MPQLRFVGHDDGGLTRHACLGRDCGRDVRVVDADLQRALAHAHAAHRDRQRLAADVDLRRNMRIFPMI